MMECWPSKHNLKFRPQQHPDWLAALEVEQAGLKFKVILSNTVSLPFCETMSKGKK